jgi:hypothetical protein
MGEASRRSGYMPLSGAASGRPWMINFGITQRASPDSSGYIFAAKINVSAAHVGFSCDTRT